MKQFREEFDVVITDSSDSVGTCRTAYVSSRNGEKIVRAAVRKSVDTVYSFTERLC